MEKLFSHVIISYVILFFSLFALIMPSINAFIINKCILYN